MNLIENLDEKNIVHALLEGAFLASFIFHTHFQLIFDCQRDKEFKDKKLPREITLSILSDWWFGDKEEWDRTVKRMTEGRDYVEPEEPVLAFKFMRPIIKTIIIVGQCYVMGMANYLMIFRLKYFYRWESKNLNVYESSHSNRSKG